MLFTKSQESHVADSALFICVCMACLYVCAWRVLQAEEYTQQLGIRAKELETNPRGEEPLYHTPRYNNAHYPSYKGESPSGLSY